MNQALLDLLSALNGASPAIITRCCRLARIKDAKTLANVDALLDGREVSSPDGKPTDVAITFSMAAARLSSSTKTIQRMIKDGELVAITVRGLRRVSSKSVDNYIATHAA